MLTSTAKAIMLWCRLTTRRVSGSINTSCGGRANDHARVGGGMWRARPTTPLADWELPSRRAGGQGGAVPRRGTVPHPTMLHHAAVWGPPVFTDVCTSRMDSGLTSTCAVLPNFSRVGRKSAGPAPHVSACWARPREMHPLGKPRTLLQQPHALIREHASELHAVTASGASSAGAQSAGCRSRACQGPRRSMCNACHQYNPLDLLSGSHGGRGMRGMRGMRLGWRASEAAASSQLVRPPFSQTSLHVWHRRSSFTRLPKPNSVIESE